MSEQIQKIKDKTGFNPGNNSSAVATTVGGAVGFLVIFVLRKLGVEITVTEASGLMGACSVLWSYLFGGRR